MGHGGLSCGQQRQGSRDNSNTSSGNSRLVSSPSDCHPVVQRRRQAANRFTIQNGSAMKGRRILARGYGQKQKTISAVFVRNS
ncbi:hypothetical protein M0802_003068 [Mischocyttarus mexicanus]|nr:hypothetical protein M0802_003068 [Mischocyttarus mexicanus]